MRGIPQGPKITAIKKSEMISPTSFPLRSPADKVHGIVYFGRMLDKIRLNLAGQLPTDLSENLGIGSDQYCSHFLKISYTALVDFMRENQDAGDDALMEWCRLQGAYRPLEEEIEIFNNFMIKRGWKDKGSAHLAKRKKESGFEDRVDIETNFQYIDADEGRRIRTVEEMTS